MNATVALMERVLPATVHVEARIAQEHPSARLLGSERMGSGVVVDPDGLILTVNYVVPGAEQVTVTLLRPIGGSALPSEVGHPRRASDISVTFREKARL